MTNTNTATSFHTVQNNWEKKNDKWKNIKKFFHTAQNNSEKKNDKSQYTNCLSYCSKLFKEKECQIQIHQLTNTNPPTDKYESTNYQIQIHQLTNTNPPTDSVRRQLRQMRRPEHKGVATQRAKGLGTAEIGNWVRGEGGRRSWYLWSFYTCTIKLLT